MIWSQAILCAFSGLAVLSSLVSAQWPNPGRVTGNYDGVHDPSLARNSDGLYILAGTGPGIGIRTSTDRVNWQYRGEAFSSGPAAALKYTGGKQDLWAPDITNIGGELWMYFSASQFGSMNSGIFLAKSTTGLPGTWKYTGEIWSSIEAVGYNAIDPALIIVGSRWYLSFGSFHNGIQIAELDPKTGFLLANQTPKTISKRTANGGSEEAPFIMKVGNYFYLFTAFDFCCRHLESTYNVRVSRSTSIMGPYTDKAGVAATNGGGTQILASHGSIVGPGGSSLYVDNGQVLLVYHYYGAEMSYLGINELNFSSGWPVVV